MSHLNHIRDDSSYAGILAGWDAKFYSKYAEKMRSKGRVLDIGCGVGQVVAALDVEGCEAYGVDVSHPNIVIASKVSSRCTLYDGGRLPFDDNYFTQVGALNVLEHVQDPEFFISEAVRVCAPGGRIIISSPNFLRVLGFRDYHHKMRGFSNKLTNARILVDKWRDSRSGRKQVKFDRMIPVIKTPFTPDDDAIVATNALDMAHCLRHCGCQVIEVACTDRKVPMLVDFLLNLTPLKYLMFNAWVVAKKGSVT